MANIQERKLQNGKTVYRVQIRLKGHPPQSATFDRKTDAKRWVNETEAAIREGRYFKASETRKHTLGEMCNRYIQDVLPLKSISMQRDQTQQLNWWITRLGSHTLADVSPALIADQRDYLIKNGSGLQVKGRSVKLPSSATVVRYLAALSAVFSNAIQELGWIDVNPVAKVKKPRESKGRIRFLSDEERESLLLACRNSDNNYLYPVVLIAISTAARYSEIINLDWSHIDFQRSRATLMNTKNGDRRALLLSPQIIAELRRIQPNEFTRQGLVFPSERKPGKPIELRKAWDNAISKANVIDFKFHDLRHTAASYLVMNGATLAELSEILGHKSLSMVKRYAHLSETHTRQVVTKMNEKLFPPSEHKK